jgi:hypothetical protein
VVNIFATEQEKSALYEAIGRAVSSYAKLGANAYFRDPATTVWPRLSESFGADTTYFTSTCLQNNGITW